MLSSTPETVLQSYKETLELQEAKNDNRPWIVKAIKFHTQAWKISKQNI